MALGIGRDTIMSIERQDRAKQGNKEVIQLIKSARLKVHNAYEVDLRNKNNAAGSIFALKNFGWTDQQQVDHTTGGQPFAVNVMAFGDDRNVQDAEFEEVEQQDNG